MAIEAGYIQFVDVTAQEQRILSIRKSRKTLNHLPAGQVHNFQRIVRNGSHKQALLFQIHAHVIEAPLDSRQRNRLHKPERRSVLGQRPGERNLRRLL